MRACTHDERHDGSRPTFRFVNDLLFEFQKDRMLSFSVMTQPTGSPPGLFSTLRERCEPANHELVRSLV